MDTASGQKGGTSRVSLAGGNIWGMLFRLLALAVIDAFAVWFISRLAMDQAWPFLIIFTLATLGINAAFLVEGLYPFRWFSPGLALLLLMVLYPTLFTIYVAFTNYSDGHLLTKQQAVNIITREQFLPEDATPYRWTAFRGSAGDYILWLVSEDGSQSFLATTDELYPGGEGFEGIGPLDEDGIPESIAGYQRLNRLSVVRYLSELERIQFGAERKFSIRNLDTAAQYEPRYLYDEATDTITDRLTDETFTPVRGTYTSETGRTLTPGYWVFIGFDNFARLATSPALRGPFVLVFIWNFVYAIMAVVLTFALGLFLALIFNHEQMPAKKPLRSLLLIPYAIPAFISVLIWRGMLNPGLGVISKTIEAITGFVIPFFADPFWAKVGVLLVKLWLGFPYMFLISQGALQSIPSEIYEAAEVDGASAWRRFWSLTLPLLLVAVGPLLLASFAFNFNEFTVIEIYNRGGPVIPDSPTRVGHTDILITYTYRLAFASGRGADYAYASAITMVIFVVLATITILNFRFTRTWEEVSENV